MAITTTAGDHPDAMPIDFRKLITTPKPNPTEFGLRGLLRLLCPLYWIAAKLKNVAYDRGWKTAHPTPLPTISVGNLSVGGTGKSPVVAWIARELRQQGLRVAILSRGYGQLDDGRNDEALELELALPDVPHLQNPDRCQAAELAAEELEMQAIVLDDAFQHRRIERHIDIVLVDATDPPAAQSVLPRGLYREPLSSLARADLVLLTRSDQVSDEALKRWQKKIARHCEAPILHAKHGPQELQQVGRGAQSIFDSAGDSTLRGKKVLAFCGIGNPGAFFQTLKGLGVELVDTRVWPDHHAYEADDIQALAQWVQEHSDAEEVICTVKDWVKVQTSQLAGKDLIALSIQLQLSQEDQQLLRKMLSKLPLPLSEELS
ncbi:MAG: tetraacyldisaccharide 4'-kinase [Planctomycetota bacterium]|nr:tetraacyldisaccharide 4'-kinase [Planctomycetota bacterium]